MAAGRGAKWTRLGAAVAVAVCVGLHAAAEPRVRAYVERRTVTVRKSFLFTIEITGDRIGDIKVPDVDGLNINKRPNTTSSSMEFTLSSFTKTQQFGYYAQATRTGKITIPPIVIRVDGQNLRTDPIDLTVVDSMQPAQGVPEPRYGRQSTTPGDTLTWEEVAFIESSVDRREVYQGEPIQLTLSLWKIRFPGMRVGTYPGYQMQYPAVEGFHVTTIEPVQVHRDRGGRSYELTQYRQVLYPTATGDLRIGSWHWEGGAEYGIGFRAQRKGFRFDAPPIEINVSPLPNAPANFSGSVGHFALTARLMKDRLLQGVPTKLVVRVKGRGNPNAIGAPAIPEIENLFVSDPEKETRPIEDARGLSVEKTFTYTITPLEAGELTIPAIQFCYFDPSKEVYRTEKTDPLAVQVLASAEKSEHVILTAAVPGQGGVVVLGEDIRPIITDAGKLRPHHRSAYATPVVAAVPALCYCGLALFMRRKRRFEQDVGYARDYFARSKGRKRLNAVATADEPSEELYRTVVGFVADKFNIPEAGITSGDIEQLFLARCVDTELSETFIRILRACERARYAAERLSREEVTALTQAAAEVMDRLDATLRKGRRG